MTVPAAIVQITLRAIQNIPVPLASRPNGYSARYAVITIGGRIVGRSGPLAEGASFIDLSQEAVPFVHEVELAAGESIDVQVAIDRNWEPTTRSIPTDRFEFADTVPPPWSSRPTSRSASPGVLYDTVVQRVPGSRGAAVAARSAYDRDAVTTLRIVDTLVVEITDIPGLNQPQPGRPAGLRGADPRIGYTSQDHQGRIYLHHDQNGQWMTDTHAIRLKAKVHVQSGFLPNDARLRFRVVDVDDPSDDAVGVAPDWGAYLDPLDYDIATTERKGSFGGDNEGTATRNPPWEQVDDFDLAVVSDEEATTAIRVRDDEPVGEVILHCPDVAGDNLIVRVDVVSAAPIEVYPARTGVMTMWHRIDVEHVRMPGAQAAGVADIQNSFNKACVQFDFTVPREVPDFTMVSTSDMQSVAALSLIDSVFSNKGMPGWFCVLEAVPAFEPERSDREEVFAGDVDLFPKSGETLGEAFAEAPDFGEYIEIDDYRVDKPFGLPQWVTFEWPRPPEDGSGPPYSRSFNVGRTEVRRTILRIWLTPDLYVPHFTAGDGSLRHAYTRYVRLYPRTLVPNDGPARVGAYGVPDRVKVRVEAYTTHPKLGSRSSTNGISPTKKVGRDDYFCGRAVVFLGATNLPQTEVLIHELGHALGFSHKCGYLDLRYADGCTMNYLATRMFRTSGDLTFVAGRMAGVNWAFCGRHLKEIRRVRLMDNPALGWALTSPTPILPFFV